MSTNLFGGVNAEIIRLVVDAYDQSDSRVLDLLGLNKTQIIKLRNLTMGQISQVMRQRTPIANITFDSRRFDLLVRHIEMESSRDGILDGLIVMHASAAMLYELAGMDSKSYRARRAKLGLVKATQGRPASLSSDESITLQRSWSRYRHFEDDPLKRYHSVGMDTSIPLNRVWSFMQLES